MKIFSSFDTKFRKKTYESYCSQYGTDNVLIFGRSLLYLFLKSILPTLLLIIFTLLWLLFFYDWLQGLYFKYLLIATLILDLSIFIYIIGKYIDYGLDFIVVVPTSLILYNQNGIFKRDVITINKDNISTISIERKGLLYSMFNNGNITILAEGVMSGVNNVNYGTVVLKWIAKPEKKRDKIIKTLGIDNI